MGKTGEGKWETQASGYEMNKSFNNKRHSTGNIVGGNGIGSHGDVGQLHLG